MAKKAKVVSGKNQANKRSAPSVFSDKKYPVYFALGATAAFVLNFYFLRNPILYTALAAIVAFFVPGYVLLDFFMPQDALEGFVERAMMSIALSICFTVLYASIVNLWLREPINRDSLALILISLNVLASAGRWISIKYFEK